jgi:hypothetical protein
MTALRDEFAITHDKGGFTYVSWSQVADRLDESGESWSFQIVTLGPDWCHGRLTIGLRDFDNIGYAENADAEWKKEPYKDAVSDAFKRCAALAGVARYLYDKDSPSGTGRAGVPSSSARPAAVTRPVVLRDEMGRPPPVVEDDPYADLPPPWEASDFKPSANPHEDVCPDHNVPWTLKEAGTSKAGKPYDAFWKCDAKTDGEFCRNKPSKQWQARHEA